MSRTAKIIAGLVLIGVAVGIATGWIWSSTASATEQVGEKITAVEIDNDSGNVAIRADDVSTTQVRQKFSYRFGKPDNQAFQVDDGTLKLDGCGWWCSVDYEVVVPEGTTVTGKVDSGNVTLTGVAVGEVKADSGNIDLRNVTGPMKLDVDSGTIDGTGLTDAVEATADSGNIDLQFTQPADVTADVDSGNIDLQVPSVPYQVEGQTDSGDRSIKVPTDPNGEHKLQLDTDSGDVTVAAS